jgi:CBS domain-containing protein
MNVGDIMTQEVISVSPETTVADAARLMLKERISGLPVINEAHALVGIVTEGDFLRRVEAHSERTRPQWMEFFVTGAVLADEYAQSHGRKVSEVMTRRVVTVTEDMTLEKAAALMERHRAKRLPVMRDNRVVGVISRSNFLRALTTGLPHASVSRGDKAIREQLEKELKAHSWGRIAQRQVMVNEGIVDLWGFVTSDRQRDAIRIVAENVPGVKQVRDHMLWFEPYSGILVESGTESNPPRPTIT